MKTENIYGINPVFEALKADRRKIFEIYIEENKGSGRIAQVVKYAESKKVPVKKVKATQLKSIAGTSHHQGISAKVNPYVMAGLSDIIGSNLVNDNNRFLLLLDNVLDPQNLGAIIRTALGVGIDGIIIPKDRSAMPTPAVSKASAGAIEHVCLIRVTNMVDTIKVLKQQGVWVVGLDKGAEKTVYSSDLTGSVAIVIGGEEKGIRPLVKKNCDFVVSIPQMGQVNSLNASVAAAIAMYEAFRQRERQRKESDAQQRIKVDNILSWIISAFEKALFPARCMVCGSFFHSNTSRSVCLPKKEFKDKKSLALNHLQDSQEQRVISCLNGDFKFDRLFSPYLCSACLTRYAPVESPFCIRCGIMFKSREGDDHLCGDCIKEPKRFKIARAPGIYDRTLMKAIHCLKYRGKIQMARPFGMLLFAAFIRFWDIKNIDLVVPVPLHLKRLRERGFNQAYLLVRNWKRFAMDFKIEMTDITIDRNVLVRSRWTEPQTGLGRKKRMRNIKNAFKVNDCSRIAGKRILLVDDVLTTGATVNECAKTLISDGAKRVDVLTLARAM